MTTIENIRSVIQKVLDSKRDFTSENAKAEASALNWVLELFDKYAEQEPSEDMTIAYLMGYYADKEPCDDAISREAVIEAIASNDSTNGTVAVFTGKQVIAMINKLPPIRPQEPCDDVVSREAVIEWLKAKDIIKMSSQEEMARKELKALPSVTQKPIECDDAISRKAVKSCNTCKHSDKPYSEEPCKHCCDDVAEKWESEDNE